MATQSNSKRKALQESRGFHLFKEAVKKESIFIQDKSQLAASREVGKDFVSFIRLQKKLQVLFNFVVIIVRTLICITNSEIQSGQAVQPKPLASLKLSMAVYGQKLDGQPSR